MEAKTRHKLIAAAVVALLFVGAVSYWILSPECLTARYNRLHWAGVTAWFLWFLPWGFVKVRNAWRDFRPVPVDGSLLDAMRAALELPDDADEWEESEEFREEGTAIAYEKKHSPAGMEHNRVDFEIQKT